MNAPQEEASEFAKVSKRENRVYVGNLAYDVKYGDLVEFMKPGGWKRFSCLIWSWFGGLGLEMVVAATLDVARNGVVVEGMFTACRRVSCGGD